MSLGISIYFGLDNTREENLGLLRLARSFGYERIFTSLHIPEANYDILKQEINEFLVEAKKLNMDVVCDVSPKTFEFLGLNNMDLLSLIDIGIRTIRIDYGYTSKEIANLSKNKYGIKIQINASTVSEEIINELVENNADFKNIEALHNFYPRKDTGISIEHMVACNEILKSKEIRIGAFIQSNNRKRSTFKEGLPTLEDHRGLHVSIAETELYALGCDDIFIGDSLPSSKEIISLTKVSKNTKVLNNNVNRYIGRDESLNLAGNEKEIILRIEILTDDEISLELLKKKYTARQDEARDVIRTNESRAYLEDNIINDDGKKDGLRKSGDITIDNLNYGRYMGEIQLVKNECYLDSKSNLVARVIKEDLGLLGNILGGRNFSFKIVY
ncbi:MupG family TIM beta-alpha barrel fold protein [Clostridium sp. B9]|uniref:MupG family TIM beta-alpha barrel fold protein n=1 Tax=Clostridium sp. B9 TaxID=3423224 RepID=UPI003D2F3714